MNLHKLYKTFQARQQRYSRRASMPGCKHLALVAETYEQVIADVQAVLDEPQQVYAVILEPAHEMQHICATINTAMERAGDIARDRWGDFTQNDCVWRETCGKEWLRVTSFEVEA